MSDGAVTNPSIDRSEHVDENVSAKRVAPYTWDGTNWVRNGTSQTSMYDYSSSTTIYAGSAPLGTATSDPLWTITKYDLTSSSAASGKVATLTAWDSRASGTYT